MHILDSHSLNSGLKFSKPFIYDRMFPIASNNYILIDITPCDKNPHAKYPLWTDLMTSIKDNLDEQKIDIIVFGDVKSNPTNSIIIGSKNIDINHYAFLIKNCKAYISSNSFGAGIASLYNKKTIFLQPKSRDMSTSPVLNLPDNNIIIDFDILKNISPETIANNIFKFLNINEQINTKTLHVGDFYSDVLYLDIIPDIELPKGFSSNLTSHIRFDLVKNKNNENLHFLHQNLLTKKSHVITNKPIAKPVLDATKDQIESILYNVTEDLDLNFVRNIYNVTDKVMFIFDSTANNGETLNKRKLQLADEPCIITVNEQEKIPEEVLKNWDSLTYKANKYFCSQHKFYFDVESSNQKVQDVIPITARPKKLKFVKNKELFWKENAKFSLLQKA